jgi:hypothetical protein
MYIGNILVSNNLEWIWKYLALNLTGYIIQKRVGDPISTLLASPRNLPTLAEEGNCALDCMDKLVCLKCFEMNT